MEQITKSIGVCFAVILFSSFIGFAAGWLGFCAMVSFKLAERFFG